MKIKFEGFSDNSQLLPVGVVLAFLIGLLPNFETESEQFSSDVLSTNFQADENSSCQNAASLNRTFNVLTQNVGFIPGEWLLGIGYLDKRFEMADYLIDLNAEIVVIQEGLSASALKSFAKRMTKHYPYHTDLKEAYGAKCKFLFEWGVHGKGHGIVIFSKFPILEEQHYNFENCVDGSHDCKVSKGFVKTLLSIGDGRKAYVIGTHLQSGPGNEAIKVRNTQVMEISEKISDYHNENYPMILAGDFNIDYRGEDSEHTALLDQLNVTPTFCPIESTDCNVIPPYTVPDEKALDYIFTKNNHVQPYSTSFYSSDSPIKIEISDHASVQTTFSFALKGI